MSWRANLDEGQKEDLVAGRPVSLPAFAEFEEDGEFVTIQIKPFKPEEPDASTNSNSGLSERPSDGDSRPS